jgi:hypothetical protein
MANAGVNQAAPSIQSGWASSYSRNKASQVRLIASRSAIIVLRSVLPRGCLSEPLFESALAVTCHRVE